MEVHHIIPQKDRGTDDLDNAAPLCPKCHADFGDNPKKRKEIREMRDWWYKKCEEQHKTIVLLKEKLEPKALISEFPVVFFYHKESGDLHWFWPNKFFHYYHGAGFATQQLSTIQPEVYKKFTKTDYATFFVALIERLIFAWLSLTYQFEWLLEMKRWKFPWAEIGKASRIDHPEVKSATVNYSSTKEFKENIFSEVSLDFGSFVVPEGTKIAMSRDRDHPSSVIRVENAYYYVQFSISFNSWFHQMVMPEWLSGLTKDQQKEFATVTCNIRFQAEPNSGKLNDEKMSFYQKWVEELCQEFQNQFDWLTTFDQVKNEQIIQIREILDKVKG